MINNWHVPRNKRKLYGVGEILSLFAVKNVGQQWPRDIARHLDFEEELERMGLKKQGDRRNQGGGGGRTYEAWLYALGLIFDQSSTGLTRLTMAGEALVNRQPPVPIITDQLMKFQYPSSYSLRSRVNINRRFKIRPFRFILRLLADPRIQSLYSRQSQLMLLIRS